MESCASPLTFVSQLGRMTHTTHTRTHRYTVWHMTYIILSGLFIYFFYSSHKSRHFFYIYINYFRRNIIYPSAFPAQSSVPSHTYLFWRIPIRLCTCMCVFFFLPYTRRIVIGAKIDKNDGGRAKSGGGRFFSLYPFSFNRIVTIVVVVVVVVNIVSPSCKTYKTRRRFGKT